MNGTDNVHVRNVVLEMSLRPFANDLRPEAMRATCREMFRQWRPLTKHAETVSVMFWTADGSEILDYAGALDDKFEWAKWIGGVNPMDPDGRHEPYMENPPDFTYGMLRNIIAIIKEVGMEETGLPIRVGETFDPGPEFAVSSFKYERHAELLSKTFTTFVSCDGVLKGDRRPYAGFPGGIPDGMPFGTFLGRQCQHFLTDMGFDYIWLSNGFGYGADPWRISGRILNAEHCAFEPEHVSTIRKQNLDFWKLFRAECPEFPIETRGTNLTAGIDLASDGVSVRDIYQGGFNMRGPVNSPWTPINGFLGVEMAGWMSHIAELPPEGGYPYRFYIHDVWWKNDPWLDRYGRDPYDIYLPLSVGRLNEKGEMELPDSINFLSVDDSFGKMPEQVPNEVIPHLLSALADQPDAPGPVVWAYPLDEYEARTYEKTERIGEVFGGDWLICTAINDGFPLNTVGSTRIVRQILHDNPARLAGSVLLTPVPDAGSEFEAALMRHVRNGGKALLYGSLTHASGELRTLLGISLSEPLSGEFDLEAELIDTVACGQYPMQIRHDPIFSSGGWSETPAGNGQVFAVGKQAGTVRAAAAMGQLGKGGAIAWVRGTVSLEKCVPSKLWPDWALRIQKVDEFFPPEALLRLALARLGLLFAIDTESIAMQKPLFDGYRLQMGLTVSRRANGYFFSGYPPAVFSSPGVRLRLPQGAPILEGLCAKLENGTAKYVFSQTWHRECRVFVTQDAGEVFCNRRCPGDSNRVRDRLLVGGLVGAKLRFYPESGKEDTLCVQLNPAANTQHRDDFPGASFTVMEDATGRYVEMENVTGSVVIFW